MNLATTLHFPVGLSSLAAFKPSLRDFYRWLVDGSAPAVRPMQRHSLRLRPEIATKSVAARAYSALENGRFGHAKSPNRLLSRPTLRVLRVHEAGQARSSVGRMVISGRMADVCAELDRLAAQETQVLAAAPSR
jgi:hypothetical protein